MDFFFKEWEFTMTKSSISWSKFATKIDWNDLFEQNFSMKTDVYR